MGLKRIFKKTAKKFSPERYIGIEFIKGNAGFIKQVFSTITKRHTPVSGSKKTFEQLLRESGMSEVDLQKRIKWSRSFILFGGACLILLYAYAFYLLFASQWLSALVTLCVSVMFTTYVWREHFMMTQLKYRRSVLTFKEWLALTFKRK